MQLTDHMLWSAVVSQQDRYAFGLLFERHYDCLRDYAFKLLQDKELAEEVVCDVWVRLWAQRQRLTLTVGLKPYLYRATRNRCIDELRRRAKQPQQVRDALEMVHPHYASPEVNLISQEACASLDRWVAALPPQGQHIFRLCREERLSYQAVAEQLGISVRTVETHMRRSLMFLREKLKREWA